MARRRLGPLAASALVVLGATTGISLVGYWLWLRPLLSEPVDLPQVERPRIVLATGGGHRAATCLATRPAQRRRRRGPLGRRGDAARARRIRHVGGFKPASSRANGARRSSRRAWRSWAIRRFSATSTFAGRGTFRVVLVGPFASREEADVVLPRLRARARIRAVDGTAASAAVAGERTSDWPVGSASLDSVEPALSGGHVAIEGADRCVATAATTASSTPLAGIRSPVSQTPCTATPASPRCSRCAAMPPASRQWRGASAPSTRRPAPS